MGAVGLRTEGAVGCRECGCEWFTYVCMLYLLLHVLLNLSFMLLFYGIKCNRGSCTPNVTSINATFFCIIVFLLDPLSVCKIVSLLYHNFLIFFLDV